MTKEATRVLSLYKERDNAAKAEMALEDEIFNERQRTRAEAEALGKEYQKAKDRRAYASVQSAIAYMQLSPEEKRLVTDSWKQTSEGKRKAATTGVRGKR